MFQGAHDNYKNGAFYIVTDSMYMVVAGPGFDLRGGVDFGVVGGWKSLKV